MQVVNCIVFVNSVVIENSMNKVATWLNCLESLFRFSSILFVFTIVSYLVILCLKLDFVLCICIL